MISTPRRRALGAAVVCTISSLGAGCARTDAGLQQAVAARLAADPRTAHLHIEAAASRHIIFLSGMTDTPEEQQRALDVARSVRGVTLIVNDIGLNQTELVGKVRRALSADPLLAAVPIEVEAEDGIVRLMSSATNREQRARAVQITSGVDGVKDVKDLMR